MVSKRRFSGRKFRIKPHTFVARPNQKPPASGKLKVLDNRRTPRSEMLDM